MTDKMRSMRIIDPRVGRASQVLDVISEGPASVTYVTVNTPVPATLTPTFVVLPPSVNTGVSRVVRLHMAGTLVLTGDNLTLLTATTNQVALRQFALQSIMQNLQCQINDCTVSIGSIGQFVPMLASLGFTSGSMAEQCSTAPTIPDIWAEYTNTATVASGLYGSLGDGAYGDAIVSGRTSQITSVVAADGKLTIGFDISEPLLLMPFAYTNNESKALYGISNMTITMAYANFHRMVSLPKLDTVTITTAELKPTVQKLELTMVTPSETALTDARPEHIYDYSQVNTYSTPSGVTVAAPVATDTGYSVSSTPITSNAINLSVVPSKIIVSCGYNTADQQAVGSGAFLADIHMPISNCTVQFGTKAGLLAGATPINLWEIYRRGGGSLPYPIWAGQRAVTSVATHNTFMTGRPYAGGPLIIDCALDLSLPGGDRPLAVGMNQNIQFSLTGTFANTTKAPIVNPILRIVVITPGFLASADGKSRTSLGGVTAAAAASAPIAPIAASTAITDAGRRMGLSGGAQAVGGDWLDDFGRGFMMPFNAAASVLGPVAKLMGAGASIGGARLGGEILGGMTIGGARGKLFKQQ